MDLGVTDRISMMLATGDLFDDTSIFCLFARWPVSSIVADVGDVNMCLYA
jgi:hypothetical protein